MAHTGIGRKSLKRQLAELMLNGTTITEVVLESDDYDLMGVTITSVQGDFVVFSEVGSGGVGTVYVPYEAIVAINV